MKKILTLSALVLLFSASLVGASLTVASAYTCGKDSDGKPIETSIDFGNSTLCNGDGASPITAILLWAINIMGAGVGIAVVFGIVTAGIMYVMSDGDEGKVKEAREIIANAIIGLFLFIFLWAAANFLIPGGLFK